MQDPREVVDKIRREENDLSAELNRLEYFMMTEDYQRISDRQKLLLKQQHEVMTAYKRILIARVIQINFEEKDKKEPAEIKPKCRDYDDCLKCPYYKDRQCTNPECYDEPEEKVEAPLCPLMTENDMPECIYRIGKGCMNPRTKCYTRAKKLQQQEEAEDGTPLNQ